MTYDNRHHPQIVYCVATCAPSNTLQEHDHNEFTAADAGRTSVYDTRTAVEDALFCVEALVLLVCTGAPSTASSMASLLLGFSETSARGRSLDDWLSSLAFCFSAASSIYLP